MNTRGRQGENVERSGDTSTSQMSQHALALRFLTRTQSEVAQLRALLPNGALPLEPVAVGHIERMAHHISSAAEAFGFIELGAIAGAIELLASIGATRSLRERLELSARLKAQIAALNAHVQHEINERNVQEEAASPMSAHLPGFGSRRS